jgi:hypothetical protein
MKKKFAVIFALVVVLLLAVTPVTFAKDVTYTLKGMITAIEDPDMGTIIIHNSSDGYVNVFLPNTFDIGTLAPGYTVSFKGLWVEGGFSAEQALIVSDILVGTFFGEPVENGGYFITVKLYEDTVVTVLLPVGFPIDGLEPGDTVRFKGSWVEGVFVVDDEKGVCLEGTVKGSTVLYSEDPERYAITLNIGSSEVEIFVGILLPVAFDTSTVPDGVFIRACGTWVDALPEYEFPNILDAYSVEVNPVEDGEVIEPGGRGGVYCDGLKENHPLWVKIAKMYGVGEDWVKKQFCLGFGYGEIMIALKIHDMLMLEGVDVDPRWILAERNEHGWGYIKKFFEDYSGPEDPSPGSANQQDNKPLPPGLAKKLNDDSDQDGPPGWAKKPNNGKGPKKNK